MVSDRFCPREGLVLLNSQVNLCTRADSKAGVDYKRRLASPESFLAWTDVLDQHLHQLRSHMPIVKDTLVELDAFDRLLEHTGLQIPQRLDVIALAPGRHVLT